MAITFSNGDSDAPPIGDTLLATMQAQGFSMATLRGLNDRPDLIRWALAKTVAGMQFSPPIQSVADPIDPSRPLFRVPLEPLNLEPTQWKDFIEERNRVGGRGCNTDVGAAFWEDPIFGGRAEDSPGALFLLETAHGQRPLLDMQDCARQLSQSCLTCTTPRAIFEVLNTMWSQLNDINAAYIMVAASSTPAGGPMPIIFNPPQGHIRLGFVKQVPRNSSYTGYVAYCG
jgi:hypothetical protein